MPPQVVGRERLRAVGDHDRRCANLSSDAARQQACVVYITAQIEAGHLTPCMSRPGMGDPASDSNMGASQLLDADGQTRILGADQTAEIKGNTSLHGVRYPFAAQPSPDKVRRR